MKAFWKHHSRKVVYALVGGLNTVFGYVVFVSLFYWTSGENVHYVVVLVLSHVISVTNAYFLYKRFVFKTKGNIVREYYRFCTFYWLSFIFNLVSLPLLVEVFHQNPVASQGVVTIATAVSSYLWHANYSFNPARRFRESRDFCQ